MAMYDQGGGCPCGVMKVCKCGLGLNPTTITDKPNIIETKQTIIEPKKKDIKYKYNEDVILKDLGNYLASTYGQHYTSEDSDIQCFDAWIARGDSTTTFINTALKYLWRYGKKNGNNKDDLMKALHYIFMALHVDHYMNKK